MLIDRRVHRNTEIIIHPKPQHFGLVTGNLNGIVDCHHAGHRGAVCISHPDLWAADVAARESDAAAPRLRTDYRTYCSEVPIGGGRVIECLRENGPSLSRQCRSALMSARQGRKGAVEAACRPNRIGAASGSPRVSAAHSGENGGRGKWFHRGSAELQPSRS
jgi:hypothetical protein